tara:strand:- start:745 stop:1008 length:264 start_codon:yes stop_codon:yes gene_type:complete
MKAKNDMSFHKMLDGVMDKVNSLPKEHFVNERKEKIEEINRRNMNRYFIDYEKELLRGDLTPYQRQKYRELQTQKENNEFPELKNVE